MAGRIAARLLVLFVVALIIVSLVITSLPGPVFS
jgi:hypothetical protein